VNLYKSPDLVTAFPLPTHAYVPGQNSRHPEDWFDPIKASVTADVPVAALDQTAAWQAGRVYFDAGYYWECHEVLEAVWLRCPDPSPERAMTQAVIQLANARLKLRMDKPRASLRLCDMVDGHLAQCSGSEKILGIAVQEIAQRAQHTRVDAKRCIIRQ
jgi:hypothetical protein